MRAVVNVAEFFSPGVSGLCKYWIERSQGRAVIPRGEVDPLDMPKTALPYVLLIDLSREPIRISYRLVGTSLAAAYGLDFTGLELSSFEVPNGLEAAIVETYREVVRSETPAVGHYGYPNHHGRLVLSEFAVFPLSNGGLVDQCLAVEHLDVRAECFSGELVPLKRRA